jgi:hypothetical protein
MGIRATRREIGDFGRPWPSKLEGGELDVFATNTDFSTKSVNDRGVVAVTCAFTVVLLANYLTTILACQNILSLLLKQKVVSGVTLSDSDFALKQNNKFSTNATNK